MKYSPIAERLAALIKENSLHRVQALSWRRGDRAESLAASTGKSGLHGFDTRAEPGKFARDRVNMHDAALAAAHQLRLRQTECRLRFRLVATCDR